MRILPALLVALLFAAACDSPYEIYEEQPMRPVPEIYRTWYSEIASCIGKDDQDSDNRFRMIRWYSASKIWDPTIKDRPQNIWGVWRKPHDIIIREDMLLHETTVKHELVHDLIPDDLNHQSPYFESCAGM